MKTASLNVFEAFGLYTEGSCLIVRPMNPQPEYSNDMFVYGNVCRSRLKDLLLFCPFGLNGGRRLVKEPFVFKGDTEVIFQAVDLNQPLSWYDPYIIERVDWLDAKKLPREFCRMEYKAISSPEIIKLKKIRMESSHDTGCSVDFVRNYLKSKVPDPLPLAYHSRSCTSKFYCKEHSHFIREDLTSSFDTRAFGPLSCDECGKVIAYKLAPDYTHELLSELLEEGPLDLNDNNNLHLVRELSLSFDWVYDVFAHYVYQCLMYTFYGAQHDTVCWKIKIDLSIQG